MRNRNGTEINTRFILFVGFLFLLVPTTYFSLFTQIPKGSTVAELVSFTMQHVDAKICFSFSSE